MQRELHEAYLRVADRLNRDGWPEDQDLDEAVANDPEYAAAVQRSLPPVRLGTPAQQDQRRQRAEALIEEILA